MNIIMIHAEIVEEAILAARSQMRKDGLNPDQASAFQAFMALHRFSLNHHGAVAAFVRYAITNGNSYAHR